MISCHCGLTFFLLLVYIALYCFLSVYSHYCIICIGIRRELHYAALRLLRGKVRPLTQHYYGFRLAIVHVHNTIRTIASLKMAEFVSPRDQVIEEFEQTAESDQANMVNHLKQSFILIPAGCLLE
jgi:hypothetical protein